MTLKGRTGRLFPAAVLLGLTTVLATLCLSASALANEASREGPLTQADIDAYIYMAPRLFGEIMNYPDEAVKLLNEVKLTRRRAIYIATKIPLTQALARGLISPGRLMDIPAYLHPTTEEVQLINSNLMTLMQAESAAIDSSGIEVPRIWREAPLP
jgi:hypothetical protein